MTSRELYEILASVLSYPTAKIAEQARQIYDQSLSTSASQKSVIAPFSDYVVESRQEEIEELFTRTFDMNPTCCLEIGWHKFGEDYQRGEFMVNMRNALEEEGMPESTELPDHISHCLLLLARLETPDEFAFSQDFLQPAIEKILDGLEEDNPYASVILFLKGTLELAYGPAKREEENTDSRLIELPMLNDSLQYNNLEDMMDGNGKVR